MKLLLTVLILIVLPTAWLSLLAGRSIQARELLLNRRLENEAQQTLEQIGAEIDDAIYDVLQKISHRMHASYLDRDDIRKLDDVLAKLREESSLFARVYLFSEPWGFIYPEQAIPDHPDISDHDVLLAQELAMRLSRSRQRLFFAIEDRIYVFRIIRDDARLLAGVEIVHDGLISLLERLLREYSTPHIEYRLLRVGPLRTPRETYPAPDLEVRDSFSTGAERVPDVSGFLRDARSSDMLVSGHLRDPFGHIEIGALAVNASDMLAARMLQDRLVWWSIFLLAIVLLSSALILILMSRKQAETARIRSIFIAGLSHDIRTPVTAMRALAESLQQGRVASPARKQQFLDSIVDECDRLQILIERVLLFFRQEQGGYYQKQPVDLVALCEGVTQAFCARHRGRIDLTLDVPHERVPKMLGDPMALEQALHNLLENVWKYGRPVPDHPDNVVPLRVRLDLASGCLWKRCLVIRVEDAGPGIVRGEQRRIFGRFYRGRAGYVQQSGGIGLGLALVWEIVRGHGGRVRVEKSSMGGACFVLRFRPRPLTWASWKHFAVFGADEKSFTNCIRNRYK